jgi:hypothetical protein
MEPGPQQQDIREQIGAEKAPKPDPPNHSRHSDTKELHVRVSIPNYQYLDQIANRYGMRSLSSAVNFLIEFHRECQVTPTLGRALSAAKQDE